MTARLVRHLLGIPFILALPVVAWAQEASIGGTVIQLIGATGDVVVVGSRARLSTGLGMSPGAAGTVAGVPAS